MSETHTGTNALLLLLRANRPRRATGGTRKAEYLAGLTQAEQLWSAAQTVGPEASPILLFYGLAQASRAICVAGLDRDRWKAPARHGLECKVTTPAEGSTLELDKIWLVPTGDSLLARTAEVLGSPVLQRACTLAEVIATRETKLLFSDEQLQSRRPLNVHANWDPDQWDGPPNPSLTIGPVPDLFTQNRETVPASPTNLEYRRIVPPDVTEVEQWLMAYPTLAKLGRPSSISIGASLRTLGQATTEIDAWVEWENARAEDDDDQFSWTRRFIDNVDDGAGWRAQSMSGVTYPAVGGNSAAMHPLIAWWLILFGASILARYYPRAWARTLNLDESKLSVPLRHLLEAAHAEIRELVARSLVEESP